MSVSFDTPGAIAFKGPNGNTILLSAPATLTSNSLTVPATSGIALSGTVENPSFNAAGTLAAIAAGNRTLNSKSGRLVFTGVSNIAGSGTDTLTILNSAAGSSGIVDLQCAVMGNDSNPRVSSVVWTPGVSIAVTIRNYSAANGTAAGGAFNFSFISFN